VSEELLLPSEVESRRALERALDELDRAWSEYVSKVRQLVDEWEKVRVKLLEKISRASSLLRSINEDLERLNLEIALGLASEEEKREERERLEAMRAKLEGRLKALQDFLETIEGRVLEHSERLR